MSSAATPTTPESIRLLTSIDKKLDALIALIAAKGASVAPAVQPGSPASRPASEYEMTGEYGDPVVKMKDPKNWTGPTMQGRKFSECPPEYLDMVADRLEYFAMKSAETNELANNGKPKADYQALDARRSRGWAARLRAGWKPPADATPSGWSNTTTPFDDDPEIQL